MIRTLAIVSGTLLCLTAVPTPDENVLHTFNRVPLSDEYFSEGANFGDLNRDGVMDVVYGPLWFAGPDYKTRHEIYQPKPQNREAYSDHFFHWVYDFNGDGWNDVFVVGFPGTPAFVYENPGRDGAAKHWPKHQVFDWVSNESPHFTNLVGDERPELVCTRDGYFGYAEVDWTQPLTTWKFHAISERIATPKFGHGLGVGDVNGDGRLDLLMQSGWLEQPASRDGESQWPLHKFDFTRPGGADMHAYDVDGDADIITSLAAHEFGLAWFEQVQDGGESTFRRHLIMGSKPQENRYGVLFSELHSVALADIDGDGLKDIVTGKTFYSHHKLAPMWDAGAVVYWFKLVRSKNGVDWLPFRADDESGIGRQVIVGDVNGDKLPDIVVGGMKGSHVLIHRRTAVTRDEWERAQPKPRDAANTPQ